MTDSVPQIDCEPVLYSEMRLHGTQFLPESTPTSAVLIVSPLFDEKRCAYRALVCSARKLAENGAIVLHPDLYGTGNSMGNLTEIGIDRWLEDILAAHEFLRERSGNLPITVVGFRAGALLAAQAISSGLPVDRFILCQPVIDGRNYLNQLNLRRTIQHKMTGEEASTVVPYEVDGEVLSRELYIGLQEMLLNAEIPPVSLRLLQCSFNDSLLADYARLSSQFNSGARASLEHGVKGKERLHISKIVCEPFWLPHTPGEYPQLVQAVTREVFA